MIFNPDRKNRLYDKTGVIRPDFPAFRNILHSKYSSFQFFLSSLICISLAFTQKPNVVLVMTDDQGYGDIGAHGNPDIVTPNLDQLHSESVRLTNFHVNTLCAPTRASLMTGMYNMRTGVWATIFGRSPLKGDHITMAEIFKMNGYKTGMFGKWHLGDNWPMYPRFQGFDEVLTFGGGTITNIADYWGNDLFDDHYLHNGEWEQQTGYCTDIWFNAATEWIKANKQDPFFVYIPTNAPHSPFKVQQEYIDMYTGTSVEHEEFYGMITRLDHDLGLFRQMLVDEGLAENTIVIFMTDNGTVAGQGHSEWDYYNAGMRGSKGSPYDGGHRVPFFMHWPAGGLKHGQDDNRLTAHVDLIPTFIEMLGLTPPQGVEFDGIDISPILKGPAPEWNTERTVIMSRNGSYHDARYNLGTVMKGDWRLVRMNELFNIADDPHQDNNIIARHPDLVQELTAIYDEYWDEIEPQRNGLTWIPLGSDEENPSILTGHDWQPGLTAAWASQARSNKKETNGWFSVHFIQDGRYNFGLRKYPEYEDLQAATSIMSDVDEVRFKLSTIDSAYRLDSTFTVTGEFDVVNVELDLTADSAIVQAWLDIPQNQGAFFIYVTRLTPNTIGVKDKPRYDITRKEIQLRLGNLRQGETLKIYNAYGRVLYDSRKHHPQKIQTLDRTAAFAQFNYKGKLKTQKLIL